MVEKPSTLFLSFLKKDIWFYNQVASPKRKHGVSIK